MRTYTHSQRSPIALVREAINLYKIHSRKLKGDAHEFINLMQRVEDRVCVATGVTLANKATLIIGSGQNLSEPTYFAIKNRVTAIDMDVIPTNNNPLVYLKMLRQNGAMRTAKTLGRKITGLDKALHQSLKRELHIATLPPFELKQMNAEAMTFTDNSFDFIYSFSVFEHLANPSKVMDEMNRVLRPGGIGYISLHLYTCDCGCHDPRIWANQDRAPYWAHLREKHADKVQPNAYLNKLRIAEWKQLYQEKFGKVTFDYNPYHDERMEFLLKELAPIRQTNELDAYTDEELLNVNLIAIWKK